MNKHKRYRIATTQDGEPLCVLRPDDPEAAIAAANKAVEDQDLQAIQAAGDAQTGFTFVGYLAQGQNLAVDENGFFAGKLQPGDFFSTVKDKADVN